ncbi:MAG: AAA domain-containing protein, partial [Halobaculum sp.]
MIAELVETWRLADARLLSADVDRDSYPPVDIETALDHATDAMAVETSDPEGYAIPLFEPNTPKPTAEYVVYRPEREQLGWHDTGFGVGGTERFTDASDLAGTEIGHRLRFWIPENRPGISAAVTDDDLPPRAVDPSDPLDDAEATEFFDDLLDFVRSERDSELASNRSSYERHDPESRLHRPEVTGPFERIGGIDRSAERSRGSDRSADRSRGPDRSAERSRGPDDGTYRYRLPDVSPEHVDLRGDHGLFAGNWCLADAEHPAFPVTVRLSAVEDPHVSIQPQWERIDESATVRDRLAEGDRLWLAPLLNPVPFDRRIEGIESVRADERKRDLLTGNRSLRFSANRYTLPESDVDLNRHQHDALIWADGADDVVCLHGPPGTGKSRTLTAYVQCAVEKGQSVLVTAHSNQAVDNLLVGESTVGEPEPQTLH